MSNPLDEGRLTLILDTSAVNRLTDDADCDCLIEALTSKFHVRVMFPTVDEVAADSNAEHRPKLLAVCRRLLASGDCIDPPDQILQKLIASFESSSLFDWAKVDVGFPECAAEDPVWDTIGNESCREIGNAARQQERRFDSLFKGAQAEFEAVFERLGERPASLASFVRTMQGGKAYQSFVRNLYTRFGGMSVDEVAVRTFVKDCPPFRAVITGILVALYDRCVRGQRPGPSLRTGRADTFMSIYLPFCDQFVTDDKRQRQCFAEVAVMEGFNVSVRSFDEFRSSI